MRVTDDVMGAYIETDAARIIAMADAFKKAYPGVIKTFSTKTGYEQCKTLGVPAQYAEADAQRTAAIAGVFSTAYSGGELPGALPPKADLLKPGTFALHTKKGRSESRHVEIGRKDSYEYYKVRKTGLRGDGNTYGLSFANINRLIPLCPDDAPAGTLVKPMWEDVAPITALEKYGNGAVCTIVHDSGSQGSWADCIRVQMPNGKAFCWPTRLLELVRLGPGAEEDVEDDNATINPFKIGDVVRSKSNPDHALAKVVAVLEEDIRIHWNDETNFRPQRYDASRFKLARQDDDEIEVGDKVMLKAQCDDCSDGCPARDQTLPGIYEDEFIVTDLPPQRWAQCNYEAGLACARVRGTRTLLPGETRVHRCWPVSGLRKVVSP